MNRIIHWIFHYKIRVVNMSRYNELIKNYKHFLMIKLGFFRRYLLNNNFKRNTDYVHNFNKLKIKNNVILYESSNAKRINGNPYALFKFLVDNPDYKDYIHVWSTKDLKDDVVKEYSSNKNVKFVLFNSKQYLKYLTIAKYLINDSTFPYFFIRKEDQIYVNIWHGTPLKSMGKDINGAIGDHKNIQRNFLHTSYLINSNKFTSEVLLKSHDIHTLYNGHVANIGYPCVDLLFNTDKKKLKDLLGVNEDETIVLYAPTWRGKSHLSVDDTVNEIEVLLDNIKNNLPPNFRLFVKLHTYTMKFVTQDLKKLAIPEHLDINEMLSITDILITDYSSVFFEFLSTKRPILFFCYDKDEYIKERGLYIPLEDLPGPICETSEEIINSLKNINLIQKKYEKTYSDFIKKFAYYDDGNASKRVADLIFNNKSFPEHEVYKIGDERKKLLLYPGSLLDDEVTVDFINLVNSLDHKTYDIYVFLDHFSKMEIRTNILKLSKNVKILYKIGGFCYSLHNYYWHYRLLDKGVFDKDIKKNIPTELYVNETKRLFASSNFDSVLDFRGERREPVTLFAFGKFKRKYIYSRYLINEPETSLIPTKRRVSKKNLKIIISLNNFFDKIFFNSINPEFINRSILNEFLEDKTKLKPLKIPVDYKNILKLARPDVHKFDNKEYQCGKYKISDKKIEISCIALPDKEYVNFIFSGKLIYNEGVSKLINAFAKVNDKYMNTRIYIIGEGSLNSYLKNKVSKLGLEDKIIFVGSLTNLFWILNICDCVLSPSNNIERNTSLIESLVLEKPIISNDTPNSKEIFTGGYGMLVENSEEGLLKGMTQFIEEGYEQKYFDFVEYNEKALKNFYTEVFDTE
jgi:CDP-glycerol glycerophosphotransferase